MLTAFSSAPSLPEPPPGNRDWQGVTTTCGTCARAQALSLLLRRPADPLTPAQDKEPPPAPHVSRRT